jgi:hypothetical protein
MACVTGTVKENKMGTYTGSLACESVLPTGELVDKATKITQTRIVLMPTTCDVANPCRKIKKSANATKKA